MSKVDILNRLIDYYTDGNKARFAKMLGVKPQTINSWFIRDTFDIDLVYSKCVGINADWLLTGEGDMLQKQTSVQSEPSGSGIPYFEQFTVEAGTGRGDGTEAVTMQAAAGFMRVPGIPQDGTLLIRSHGRSMINAKDPSQSIPEGAWVAIRPANSRSIQWGEVYAVMTTDGPVIKKLLPSERENHVQCVSYNEDEGYLPFDLDAAEIIGPMFRVVGVIDIRRFV